MSEVEKILKIQEKIDKLKKGIEVISDIVDFFTISELTLRYTVDDVVSYAVYSFVFNNREFELKTPVLINKYQEGFDYYSYRFNDKTFSNSEDITKYLKEVK